MMMRPPLNGATPEKPVGFGFYYMTSTLEAEHTLSCPPTSSRGHGLRCVRPYSAVLTLFVAPRPHAVLWRHCTVPYSRPDLGVFSTPACTPHSCYHTTHGTEPTLDSLLWRYGARRISTDPKLQPVVQKFLDPAIDIRTVDNVGPSPLLVHKAMLKRVARPWWDLSVKMKHDSDANHIFGWVLRDVGLHPH